MYQWGTGYFGEGKEQIHPDISLKGQNLVSLSANDDFVFALNGEGKVFQVPAKKLQNKKSLDFQASWFGVWIWFKAPQKHPHEISLNGLGNDKVTKISAGKSHIVALTKNGRVFSGALNDLGNYFGQLGMGYVDSRYKSPIPEIIAPDPHTGEYSEDPRARIIEGVAGESRNPSEKIDVTELYEINQSFYRDESVMDISSGYYHTLALTKSGRVFGFGSNEMLVRCLLILATGYRGL